MFWKALNESEYYRQIFELATLGVFVSDLEGNCVYINKEWEEISGQTREDALGSEPGQGTTFYLELNE